MRPSPFSNAVRPLQAVTTLCNGFRGISPAHTVSGPVFCSKQQEASRTEKEENTGAAKTSESGDLFVQRISSVRAECNRLVRTVCLDDGALELEL